jgi:hypothetical protein
VLGNDVNAGMVNDYTGIYEEVSKANDSQEMFYNHRAARKKE